MNAVRTLPIRVAPLPGESIDSWLEAISHRCETAWEDLLSAVTLRSPDNKCNTWVMRLTTAQAAAIGMAAGVAPHLVHAMTLAHYADRAVGIDAATGRFLRAFPWGRARGSRYCPYCLADTGGRWKLTWRLGWAFACPQHRCLLADICPTCHGAQRHNTHIFTAVPRPGHCANPAIGQTGAAPVRCGSKLADTPVPGFDDDHPLLAAQRTVYDVIERGVGDFGVYRTAHQPRRAVLADIRAVAGRILAYAAPEDLDRVVPADLLIAHRAVHAQPSARFGRPRAEDKPGLAAPVHATTAAVGVTAALRILGARDIDSAGNEMRWLVTGARTQGLSMSATTLGRGGRGKSDTLYAVQLTALCPLLSPGDQLRYRIGTATPRRPTSDPDRVDRLARRTPTLLWPTWSLRLATAECNQKQLRPALSTALLFVDTRIRIRDAAALLASPLHEQSVLAVLRKLAQSNHWDHIREALTRLADYLAETDTPIDYQRRRQIDYRGLLPTAEWTRICRDTGTAGGNAARAKNIRFYLFERLSGMPATAAPVTAGNDEALKRAAEFPRHLTPELDRALLAYAQDFLRQQGITDEPVTWHPPTDLMHDLILPSGGWEALDIPFLHRLIRSDRLTLSATAVRLSTTIDDVRYALECRPAPAATPAMSRRRKPQTVYAAAKSALPPEKLIQLYHGEGRNLRDIAATVGVSRQTIGRLATEYGITLRQAHRRPIYDIDPTWLYEQYVTNHRSLVDIAGECGMSVANMARWAKVHNIPVRRLSRFDPDVLRADDRIPAILRPALASVGGWERLQRLVDVSRYRTLRVAAKELGLNQFALIDQVNRLERDLGTRILVRAKSGHAMTLTPFGSQVTTAVRVFVVAQELKPEGPDENSSMHGEGGEFRGIKNVTARTRERAEFDRPPQGLDRPP